MSAKRLVSLFYFNDNIAGKDMFLVPKYLSEKLEMTCEFVFPKWKENENIDSEYRGVKLTPIKSKSQYYSTLWSEKEMLFWLVLHARKIDVLTLFWLNKRNILFSFVYKFLNPQGVCYIKGDFNEKDMLNLSCKNENKFKATVKNYLYKSIDVISAETYSVYHYIKYGNIGSILANKIEYLPNALDVNLLNDNNIKVKSFNEKKKSHNYCW